MGGRVREVVRVRELEKAEKAAEFREKIAAEREVLEKRRGGRRVGTIHRGSLEVRYRDIWNEESRGNKEEGE